MTKRRKRFKTEPRGHKLNLVDRDYQILLGLYHHRFLNSVQIEKITQSPSRQHLSRRLRKLFDHQYIDRPSSQIEGGNAPMIYGLGNRGVQLLKERYDFRFFSSGRWKEKNAQVGRLFLNHTIDVAEQLIAFETSCVNHPGVRYLSAQYILEKGASEKRRKGNPLAMKSTIEWNKQLHQITTVPDGMFGIYNEQASERDRIQFLMMELDEATMPVIRSELRQSSIVKKMKGYASIIRSREHTKQFGMEAFRVLWVTTSWERIESMQAAYKKSVSHLIQPGFFIFTTMTELSGKDPLDPGTNFQSASGKPFSFLPQSQAFGDAA